MTSAAIYLRVSTAEQAQKAGRNSLAVQEEHCRAWALANNAEVVRVYREEGFTAKHMKRPALRWLLRDMARGIFKVIVTYKIDRISRSARDFHNLLAQLEEWDCSLVCVTQHFDTSSPAGRLMRALLMEFAQFEREMNAERVRDNMTARARRGEWIGGPVPFGYRRKPGAKVLEPDPATASLITELFERYAKGLESSAEIVLSLRPRGYTNKRRHAGRLLRNRVYLGEINWQGKSYKSAHAPLVSQAIFDQVQRRLDMNSGKQSGPRSTRKRRYCYHLDGLLYCGVCGRHMTTSVSSNPRRDYFYYHCRDANGLRSCSLKPINAECLDQFCVERAKEVALEPGRFRRELNRAAKLRGKTRRKLQAHLEAAKRQEAQAETRIRALMDMASGGQVSDLNKTHWNAELERWTTVHDQARLRATALQEQSRQGESKDSVTLEEILRELAKHLEVADPEERRYWLRMVIGKVVLSHDHIEIYWWPESRHTVPRSAMPTSNKSTPPPPNAVLCGGGDAVIRISYPRSCGRRW